MSKLKPNNNYNNNNNNNYNLKNETKLELLKPSTFDSKNINNNNNNSKEINNNNNYPSVSFSSNEIQAPFRLGKYLKFPASTAEDNNISQNNKIARSKSLKNPSNHYSDMSNKSIISINKSNNNINSYDNNDSITYKTNKNGNFLSDLLSEADIVEEDLDRLSFSSDDTVNLINEANNYYLEDDNDVENRRMLLTEKKYQSQKTLEKLASNPNLLKQPLINKKSLKKQKDRDYEDESSFFDYSV